MITINEVTYAIRDLFAKYDLNPEDIDIVIRCKKSEIRHRLEAHIKMDWPINVPIPANIFESRIFQMNGVKVILSDYDKK